MIEIAAPTVTPASPNDLPAILATYAHARKLQKRLGMESWPEFATHDILAEIEDHRLFRVVDAKVFAGVFSLAYEDWALWDERERSRHLYLHRIAKSSAASKLSVVDTVLAWAREHCRELGREGLRMDTWASNTALIAFYERRGFRVVARKHVERDPRLPAQYQNNDFVLLDGPGI